MGQGRIMGIGMDVAMLDACAADASPTVRGDLTWSCALLSADICKALAAEWGALANAASEPNLFQTPAFIAQSLPLLESLSPRLVQIRHSGELIGAMILRRDKGYAKLPVTFWRSALHHEQFLGTPLVKAGYEDAFAKGLCQWLDQAPRDCGFAVLSMISADGPIAAAISRHCKASKRRLFATNQHSRAAIRPALHRGAQADDLLRGSRRKSIRKARRRLEALGNVTIKRLSEANQLDSWTSHFLNMENTGWKHEEGSSILSCKDETQLYRAAITSAFHAGTLTFTRLCLDGTAIAYTLDIAAGDTGFCLKSAIDQSYRKYSPGVLMEHETLRHYLDTDKHTLLDSCSAPDNAMLNELWPDRITICDLAIGRKGAPYDQLFGLAYAIKSLNKTASKV
jgi:CelD/BcsL family acetyltransferase involved in cellulose biosynthesis